MEQMKLVGGHRLQGEIPVAGAKNAALPLVICALLSSHKLTLDNVPRLRDVTSLLRLMSYLGVDYAIEGRRTGMADEGQTVHLHAYSLSESVAPYSLVSKMRATFWAIGPLLARLGEARVSLPGGCAIGSRPVDYFLLGLERLGADINLESGYVHARTRRGLRGAHIVLPGPSVGATHTLMMAATLARGHTRIENPAREPEIVDLASCLNGMGARISGAGSPTIEIEGVAALRAHRHRVMCDRIEAGTYAIAAAMTGGKVRLTGVQPELLATPLDKLRAAGVHIDAGQDWMTITSDGQQMAVDITTAAWPGYPTDLQAQFMALMTRAEGCSEIREQIFENRFMHVQELARLGAQIELDGRTARISGVRELTGAEVMATDLRASVSLIVAALAARGQTLVNRIYHLDRGFERLEEKLAGCGAEIERVSEPAA